MNPVPNSLTPAEVKALVREAIASSMNNNPTKKIETFDGSKQKDVVKWLEEYEYFANAYGWPDEAKVIKLPLYLSSYARDWYTVYVSIADEDGLGLDELKDRMKDFFLLSSYDDYLRDELAKRKQGPDETVANYILAKRALCFRLDASMESKEIVRYVYDGIKPEIARMLFAQCPADFDALSEMAKNIERGIIQTMESGQSKRSESHNEFSQA